MSATDEQATSSAVEGKNNLTSLDDVSISRKNNSSSKTDLIPVETKIDSSGDHLPSNGGVSTLSDITGKSIEENSKKNIKITSIEEMNKEIDNSDRNANPNSPKTDLNITSELDTLNKHPKEGNISIEKVKKSDELVTSAVSSLTGDSENQDEEMILKWDDDDDDPDLIQDEESSNNPIQSNDNKESENDVASKVNEEIVAENKELVNIKSDDNTVNIEPSKDKPEVTEESMKTDDNIAVIEPKVIDENVKREDPRSIEGDTTTDTSLDRKNTQTASNKELPNRIGSQNTSNENNDLNTSKLIDNNEINAESNEAFCEILTKPDLDDETLSEMEQIIQFMKDTDKGDSERGDEDVTDEITAITSITKSNDDDVIEISCRKTNDDMDVDKCEEKDVTTKNLEDKAVLETEVIENTTNDTTIDNIEGNVIANSTKLDETDTEIVPEKNINYAQDSSSFIEDNPHSLNQPNVMIEIPTQELIDLEDSVNMSIDKAEKDSYSEKETEVTSTKGDIERTIVKEMEIDEPQTSDINVVDSSEKIDESVQATVVKQDDVKPSTSEMAPDTTDDLGEMEDSLGLLAEYSRVRDDDEEQEQEMSDQEDDEDADFDPDDESSNQMTADQSEDSAQHSETDQPKTAPDTELGRDADNQAVELEEVDQGILEIEADNDIAEDYAEKDLISTEKEFNFEIKNIFSGGSKIDESMQINDDISLEVEETTEPIVDIVEPETNDFPETIEVPVVEGIEQEIETPLDTMETDLVKIADVIEGEDMVKISGNDVTATEKEAVKDQSDTVPEVSKQSPSKTKNLQIALTNHIEDFVDLEGSSSEDDLQEIQKPSDQNTAEERLRINISKEIEVMSSGGNTSHMTVKEGDTVISVPKPPHQKVTRLNMSEVSIKTTPAAPTIVIPERKISESQEEPSKPKLALEVFNLDSDEDEAPAQAPKPQSPVKEKRKNKCINHACTSDSNVPYFMADHATIAYYDCSKRRKTMVCQPCAEIVAMRTQKLVDGIKNFTPLLKLDLGNCSQELVEISDSDSEEETIRVGDGEKLGVEQVEMLERELANVLNTTWVKYNFDDRLQETQDELTTELERLEKESAEVNNMLDECQIATDLLRLELYASFEVERKELQSLIIYDSPYKKITYLQPSNRTDTTQTTSPSKELKRRLSSTSEVAAKKPAIPLPPIPLDSGKTEINKEPLALPPPPLPPPSVIEANKLDDDKDISVVNLSAEAAPADLPPPGEVVREPLKVGMSILAMRHAFGSWLRAKIVEVTAKTNASLFTICRVRFDSKIGRLQAGKLLPARCLAYSEPSSVRMTIGTRLIALFKDTNSDKSLRRDSYYSGVVAEIPNPVNKYRYLVFFDDGYAQYVRHADTRLVCESSSLVWEEVHPFSREFVKQYLLAYPERPMVRLHTGQTIKTEWNGKWWVSRVVEVDASLVQVYFEHDKRTEWIYRGSTRLAPLYLELQAAEKHRSRPLPRNRLQAKVNMPYVEYTRSDEQDPAKTNEAQTKAHQEELRRQRAVAKKSTAPSAAPPVQHPSGNLDGVTSRVVYYTPKNAVKPHKMVPHTCGPQCKRTDVLALKDLRTYNPLAKPMLSGWERQLVRFKGHKQVMYRAPCGRRLRSMRELHGYLRAVGSDMAVDLFHFGPHVHCLAEFVLNKCIVGKKDLSHGKENVPVPCVNYYDDTLPEFCSYNTERTPTAGVPLNLDPEFLCGCDCTDDCEDKTKCACWKMTLEGARTIGLKGQNIGYDYKRLPEPLPSGIYECNSRCKCKSTCLNRVAQHPLQLKLQVFKTLNRGWGIRALNDIPKGSFLCVYAGNLLTDATANLDGLNEGDEYLAELDYIEVVEQMKEGYEDDIPDVDKKLDKKELGKKSDTESEEDMESEDETQSRYEKQDDDFEPGTGVGLGVAEFSKRLRKRDRKNSKEQKTDEQKKDKESAEDDCITISDDEELREPSRFAAQAGMGSNYIPKYKSVRAHFGKDEACYIMDAKVQGNIGRYLNHSCSPNVFVQNVFVDTHDPRFPWVAFFALNHIRAGTELTWNYNYDVGSVPGKALYCYCGAANCRGRLL